MRPSLTYGETQITLPVNGPYLQVREFLAEVVEAVIDAGATTVNIPDTVGYTTTEEFSEFIRGILENVSREMGARSVSGDRKTVKVSLVGVGMRSHAGIASRAFRALAAENINIQMISTSEIKISVVVDEKYGELAVRVLHSEFDLAG